MKLKSYKLFLLTLSFLMLSNFAVAGKVIPLQSGEAFSLPNGDVLTCQAEVVSPKLYRCKVRLEFSGRNSGRIAYGCGFHQNVKEAKEIALENCSYQYVRITGNSDRLFGKSSCRNSGNLSCKYLSIEEAQDCSVY